MRPDCERLRQAEAALVAAVGEMPAVRHLGLVIGRDADGSTTVRLAEVADHHLGGVDGGYLNGGTIAAMFDAALATSALIAFGGKVCGTTRLEIAYRRPCPADGAGAVGRITSRSEREARGEVVLRDRSGRVCAVAEGVVRRTRRGGDLYESP
jgi:uncharacterized protein (TIGR00369 family)